VVASFVAGGSGGGVGSAVLRASTGDELGTALAFGNAIVGQTDDAVADLERAEAAQRRADQAARAARASAQARRDEIASATAFLSAARDRQAQLVVDVNFEVLAEADALRQVQGRKAVVEGSINAMNRASDGVAMILAARQANQPNWVPGSVVISSPVPGAKVVSPYGMRKHPILGITRLHAGCDLDANTGDQVHAAADGVVVLAEVRGGYGNAVVIDHGHSLGTLYGHNSKLLVKAGDVVKRGDVIALAGSTGLSTGPHVHFETRVKGLPIDPEGVVDFNAPVDYPQGN
jgi:murein DD-endopeptidase MepM/ murein hydrolase activator NlpD